MTVKESMLKLLDALSETWIAQQEDLAMFQDAVSKPCQFSFSFQT